MYYRAIVKPKGRAENWVLDMLEGDNIKDFLNEVEKYLDEMGIYHYEIVNVRRVRLQAVAFDDITLN